MKKNLLILLLALCTFAAHAEQLVVDCGSSATIKATATTGYHFVRWNDGVTDETRVVSPTADVSYTAYFAINEYTIRFVNWDNSELQSSTVKHGDAVSYNGTTPTKPANAQYTYTFSGWSPNVEYTATANAVYTAQFDQITNKYTVTFKNWDGTVLESKEWEYGTMPSYTGTPTRPSDAENTYTFTGWNTNISTVTGTATYTAQFNGTTNSYLLTVSGENGTTTGSGIYQYGKMVQITATADACYKFIEWSDGDTHATREVEVTGNATYVATFQKIQYTITVQSDNETQGTVSIEPLL